MNFFYTLIIAISFIYPSALLSIPDNINYFSMMNSGSFIQHVKRDSIFSKNIYSLGIVSFPGDITSKSFNVNHSYNNLELSSIIKVLNYGELTDAPEGMDANDQLISFSIIKKNKDYFTIGASMSYVLSWIGDHKQSVIAYNFGLVKNLINNKFYIGLSIEDCIKTLDTFSNLDNDSTWDIRVSSAYDPLYAPAKLYADYVYHNRYDDEVIFALDINIGNYMGLLLGKNFYFSDDNQSNMLLYNFSIGTRIKVNTSIINIGIQYLDNGVISIGSGLATQFK